MFIFLLLIAFMLGLVVGVSKNELVFAADLESASSRTVTDALLTTPTAFAYDPFYRLLKMTDHRGETQAYTYDPDGNAWEWEPEDLLNADAWAYDALNRLTQVIDTLGRTLTRAHYEYDPLYRLAEIADALGNTEGYTYDANGDQLTVADALSFVTAYAYDVVHRLIRQTDAPGKAMTFIYDGVGNVMTQTDARNSVTTASFYDDKDNSVEIAVPDHKVAYTYDEGNHLVTTDPKGDAATTGYDAIDNPSRVTLPLGLTTGFEYDENDNVVRNTNAQGEVTHFVYDELDRLTRRTDPLNHETAYEHDALGRQVTVTDAESHATRYTCDDVGCLIQVTAALGRTLTRARYEYDGLDRVTEVTDTTLSTPNVFTYDEVYRLLAGPDYHKVVMTGMVGRQYEYDPSGNLARVTATSPLCFGNTAQLWLLPPGFQKPWMVTVTDGPTPTTPRIGLGAREWTHVRRVRLEIHSSDGQTLVVMVQSREHASGIQPTTLRLVPTLLSSVAAPWQQIVSSIPKEHVKTQPPVAQTSLHNSDGLSIATPITAVSMVVLPIRPSLLM